MGVEGSAGIKWGLSLFIGWLRPLIGLQQQ
jgi:hypothetical protein